MKLFNKTLTEYLYPIKYYILAAILVVISQYILGIPLQDKYPSILKITQALWALIVALSLLKLINIYKDFNIKNAIVLGVLYSIIIHGLKITIRFIFYDKNIDYLINRFLYGSLLVMIIVIPLGIILTYLKKKGILDKP